MRASAFRRILAPHDFSAPASTALRAAVALADAPDCELTVLHVVVPFHVPVDLPLGLGREQLPSIRAIAREQQRRLVELVERTLDGCAASIRCRVAVGDPADRIVRAGRRADLIVMATAGRTGLVHLLIGSVAEKVVRHATVPVLTIGPRPRRAARVPRPATIARRVAGGRQP
jgi:universal stress protein A